MMDEEQVTLHGSWTREEWGCAWVAMTVFANRDGVGKQGKEDYVRYKFDETEIDVWRSKAGLGIHIMQVKNNTEE